MPDLADGSNVECESCGAVWIIASTQTDVAGSDGSNASYECLTCGGTLLPSDSTAQQ